MKAKDLFTLPESLNFLSKFFDPEVAPWEWVGTISKALASIDFDKLESKKDIPENFTICGKVYIHPSVKLPPFGFVAGPTWIGEGCELRPGVFVRGNCIAGKNCVMGNSCEYKNCLLLDNVQTPHYNYIGDTIMGNYSHLGAGVICANLRLDHGNVMVMTEEGRIDSGMRKLGALVADYAEAGCNSVLQPGAILMRKSVVLSCMPFVGLLEEGTIASEKQIVRKFPRRGF